MAKFDAQDTAGGVALAEPAAPGRATHPQTFGSLAALAKDIDRLIHRPVVRAERQPAAPTIEFAAVDQIAAEGATPGAMAVSPDGRRLYVTNCSDDSVWVIDTASFNVVDVVTGVSEPAAVAAAADGRAYVGTGSAFQDSISVIDPAAHAGTETVPLAPGVRDLVANGQLVYASRTGDTFADVAVFDAATGRIDTIDLAVEPGAVAGCLAISPDGRRLYVAVQRPVGSDVVVIDTHRRCLIGTVAPSSPVRGIAVSADGATVYLAGSDDTLGGVIDIVDARTLTVTGGIPVGGLITQLVLSADGERIYVVNGDVVKVLSTWSGEIIGTIDTDTYPSCVVESRDGRLFVADYSGAVTAWTLTAAGGPSRRLKPAV